MKKTQIPILSFLVLIGIGCAGSRAMGATEPSNVSLEVTAEVATEEPVLLEDTKFKVFIKNTGKDSIKLMDRFKGNDLCESFIVTLKDKDGKFVASSYYMKYCYPREAAVRELQADDRLVLSLSLGKVWRDAKLPTRFFMTKVAEDEEYQATIAFTPCFSEKASAQGLYESPPVPVRFKAREIARYKAGSSTILSDPVDVSAPPAESKDARDGLKIGVAFPSSGTISKENAQVEVTFKNGWDEAITLFRLKPEQASEKNNTLSFIVCRKDGTTVIDEVRQAKEPHDAKFNHEVKSNDSLSVSVDLRDYLPESFFSKKGEFYLIARYMNKVGDGCLRGVWYSAPTKVVLEG